LRQIGIDDAGGKCIEMNLIGDIDIEQRRAPPSWAVKLSGIWARPRLLTVAGAAQELCLFPDYPGPKTPARGL
jgi:hypothetical protein